MPWSEAQALGVAEMDATHREFVELADALRRAGDAEFPALFAQLHEHTRRHFDNEGRLMKACRFPATGEHHAEHLRVLGELAHFGRGVAGGRLATARRYAEALPGWFATHLATMDAALAGCLRRADEARLPRAESRAGA
ncbi:bacteriohemerythrin [Azonexus sp.]|uniref:bacteriohemerythrin n=1 Tax=Azonexus sp. TaxID=1872668 RepID=UPI0035AE9FAE